MKFLMTVLIFFGVFNFTFAYSDDTTHPGLTDEIIDLFNLYYPELKISDEWKELAKKGSTDEDKKPRSMYHFYDPVYNRGIEVAGTKWQSSKDWAQDTMGQASLLDQVFAGSLTSYFNSDTDHSWDRAIYEYAWGDKERAMYNLGHVLHLIEDASVPDHTRNDPHPPWFHFGSPYEAWTSKFDAEKLEGLAKSLYKGLRKPTVFNNLQSYFNSIANYSNNNFFSKDTIFHDKYSEPVVDFEKREQLKDGSFIIVGYNFTDNDVFRLVGKIVETKWNRLADSNNANKNFILDNDHLIISDYWSRLSRQAVLHGAGVVKLFFDEVKEEKQSKILFNKNKSWFSKAYDAAKNKIFGISAILYGSSLKPNDLAELNNNSSIPQNVAQAGQAAQKQEPASVASLNITPHPPPAGGPPPLTVRGGGEIGLSSASGGDVINVGSSVSNNSGNLDAQQLNNSGGPFDTPRVAPENDNVSGSSPDAGSGSSSTPEVILPDTEAPGISLSISECYSSLSSDSCLLASSNLSISWLSTSTDIASYDVECSLFGNTCSGFSFSSTIATSTNYSLPTDEKTYQFRARARDTAGNVSSWSIINVEYFSNPVVINEIAWAGTSASSADEWIELYNKTGKNVSLSGWTLYAQDQVPYLNLSGNISANGYYLIERTDDNTVRDISADLITPFSGPPAGGGGSGLSNSGEILILSKASTTMDQTVLCSGSWCGGSNSSGRPSMERIDPAIAGTDSTNWGTSNSFVTKNGKDANNLTLSATPKKRNSLNYLISQTDTLGTNKTLTKSKSPYVVPTSQDFMVNSGAILTIEPGVVIKVGDQSSITISGNISSVGTAGDMITFTSIYDDSYEGDTNGDGSANSPTAGSWKYLRIQSPSQNSQINYTRFRYGGRYFSATALNARAMVSIYEATTTISNSIFEESQIAGLRATRFNGQISGNSFSMGTTTNTDKIGLYIYEGAPIISSNTFSNNFQGMNIELSSATTTISDSTFSNNYIGLNLTLAKVNLDNLSFSNHTIGIQSSNSTINILTPGSITFTNNAATTSPGGLF